MEEESLGDKKIDKLHQESYKPQEYLCCVNTSKYIWSNKDYWVNGSLKILFVFTILVLLSLNPVYGQSPPPNYNYKKLPETSFTCEDKATGGYYADPEAGCQMFHVCLRVSEEQINDFKFLCPNNTVFDQQNFICTNWWEIDCQRSTRYYNKNDLFRVAEETTTAEPELEEQTGYYEYVYESVDAKSLEKNITVKKLPETNHRLKQGRKEGRSFDATTTKLPYSSVTVPPVTTTTKRLTTTTTTPRITTFRYRHRFAYQSEDNIGKRAYQPAYGKKEETVILSDTGRGRGSARKSKSFDSKIQANEEYVKRKETGRNRVKSSQTDTKLNVNDTEKNMNISSNSTIHETSTVAPRMKALRRRTNRRHKSFSASKPKEKHKEFSNFRFYKTAFGRSYSSDDYLHATTTPRNGKRRARFRRPKRVRTGRTASRNTRYSKYAR